MSNLVNCQLLSKSFGARALFRDVNLTVNSGDKIGLIGPNGSGKSTLLKIICNLEDYDNGSVIVKKHVTLSYLAQSDQFDEKRSISENLLLALSDAPLDEVEKHNRVQELLSRAEFGNREQEVIHLSGGWRKRLSICRSLLTSPDVLVMDEPTNHLDIEGIIWLEKLLSGGLSDGPSSFILVSHDRTFLESCTNRIVELSAVYPQGSFQVEGNYSKFLEKREEYLSLQKEAEVRLSGKVRRETEWLRRGPKARTSKAKYRIDEAHRLQDELSEVAGRNRAISKVQIEFGSTGRKTKKLVEAQGLSKGYEGKTLFSDLDILLAPGARLGLLGRNGCGKSTLMNILAAADDEKGISPDSGTIRCADKVKIVSFDQRREKLDINQTLRRALAPEGDSIVFRGRSLHVVSWAKKFLFKADQLETPVRELSGGEQARILIASLMRQPADILLLDEPTNDLDIDSLDVLEESLKDFPGALVLVTHDRFLLDRVCDRVLGFDGKGGVAYYADYEQWLQMMTGKTAKKDTAREKEDSSKRERKKKGKAGKLSYLDQREYDQIEEKIVLAEELQENLQQEMDMPETAADSEALSKCWQKLQEATKEVERLYNRWDELEEKKRLA